MIFTPTGLKAKFEKLKARLLGSIHFRYGAPFMLLVVGSSFALEKVAKARYDYPRHAILVDEFDRSQLRDKGLEKRPEQDLEEVYEGYVRSGDADRYQGDIVRGPRPWEHNPEHEKRLRENKKVPRVVKSSESYGI